MSITITQLPAQNTIQDNTYFAVETSGITGHTSASNIKAYLSSGTLTSVTASSGSFGTMSVSGAFTASSIIASSDVTIAGNLIVLGLENVTGNIIGNLVGNVAGATTLTGNISAVISVANQPYITNLGNITLNSLIANANISAGNVSVTGITTVSKEILPVSNVAAVNIGSTGVWFNNIYGTAVHALYADLAERYTSDSQYNPGTVVIFGDETEVTASYQPNDIRVAGVVSTNPAYTMNAGTAGVDVALQGRVPCQVTGNVARGDLMVTSPIPGVAMTNNTPPIGAVIGKALGSHSGSGVGVIEVVVGRL
jgi:hypothetical protein